jgi:hypothetical protein
VWKYLHKMFLASHPTLFRVGEGGIVVLCWTVFEKAQICIYFITVQKPFVTDCMQLAEYCIINIKFLLHVQPWLKSLNLPRTWTSIYPLLGWSADYKVISVKRDIGINLYTYKWLKM